MNSVASVVSAAARLDFPRAVLFDLDGTLIDSVPDITLAVAELMETEGLAAHHEDDVRVFVGHGVTKLVERAFFARGLTLEGAALEAMTERMMGIYPNHLTGRTTLMPGAIACLDLLAARGARAALVTNKPEIAANIVLDHFRLRNRFDVVIGDSLEARRAGVQAKPAPDMLLLAMQRMGVARAETVMVGDSPADIESAANAGVFSVAVRGGYCNVPIEDTRPDVVIDTLDDFALAADAWSRR